MELKKKSKKTSISIDEELYKEFKILCAIENIKIKSFFEDSIKNFIKYKKKEVKQNAFNPRKKIL
jgi:metal-responsive CopG/Arc/MetJ family transcriptional regulator